jgi:hypothetical protein
LTAATTANGHRRPAVISTTDASVKQPSSNGTRVCLGSRRGERGAAQMLHAAMNTAGIAIARITATMTRERLAPQ